MNKSNRKRSKAVLIKTVFLTVTAAFAVICTVVLSVILIMYVSDLSISRKKNTELREMAESIEAETQPSPYISVFDTEMRGINPDYFGWLKIDGTAIDNPVVKGYDNQKYLDVSFDNDKNAYGTLFIDYRCEGEPAPHIIVHGHNARTGDMFGGLSDFLDKDYLARHPRISLTVNDSIYEYEIFSVKKTNAYSGIYTFSFNDPWDFGDFLFEIGAPPDAGQIITLS